MKKKETCTVGLPRIPLDLYTSSPVKRPLWNWLTFPPLIAKSKKARRIAARRAAKLASQGLTEEQHIPIHQQTIDLPFAASGLTEPHVVAAVGGLGKGDGVVIVGGEGGLEEVTFEQAQRARLEVRRQKRKQNRAAIKEKNFLGGL